MRCVPYLAILIAFVQIYVPNRVVMREMARLPGGFDNHDHRGQHAKLDGIGRRALGAHQNGIEAFAPFAAAVLAAVQRGAGVELVASLAIGFVVVRSAYIAAYLGDKATLRSTMWLLGVLAIAALMIAAVVRA